LPEPEAIVGTYEFDAASLTTLRHELLAAIMDCGLSKSAALQFVVAANEVATNSVIHGGGNGVARVWVEPTKVVCEIRDAGVIDQPLADRRRPGKERSASRGLWLANQLCDLVQIRSGRARTVVRLHKLLEPRPRLTVVGQTTTN
jgi:anti-sigma regulatory factor (Ser/Thr protein kinase)